jgi:Protein of unknown function (DUF3489)
MIPYSLDAGRHQSVDGLSAVLPASAGRGSMATLKRGSGAKAANPVTSKSKRGTKQQRMIDMLRRPEGATIAQMSKAFGWEPHTVRGAISGALKKKLGLSVASTKEERGRVYRIRTGHESRT